MLVSKSYNTPSELVAFLRGTPIASGSAGTNSAGSPNFGDATSGAFSDVEVGDTIYVAGEAAALTVNTVTDDNNLILSANVVGANTADASWRVFRGGVDSSDIVLGPISDANRAGAGMLVYFESNFNVA